MGNYIDKLKSLDDKSIKSLISVIKTQIRILGTEVTIEKFDQDAEHRLAFGKMFQTDDIFKAPREVTTGRIIINRNSLVDHHAKQSMPIEVYHWDKIFSSGDVATFRQGDIKYRFKVAKTYTYGLYPSVIYKYDLIGMTEDTDVLQLRNTNVE
jgi:hypothetical protein